MSTLIFAWGNPSRGDDVLGPALVERVERLLPGHPDWGEVLLLTDFQLQPEHALDLEGRERVLFVDAGLGGAPPFAFGRLMPQAGFGYTTHAMRPEAVLGVFRQVTGRDPPPAWLLAIRGEQFELGAPLSPAARAHLEAAEVFVTGLLAGGWPSP